MDKETYSEYLASEEWKALADQRRALDANKCWICGSVAAQGETYPVHHRTYERVMQEELNDLVTVCPRCHARIHNAINARIAEAKQLTHTIRNASRKRRARNNRLWNENGRGRTALLTSLLLQKLSLAEVENRHFDSRQ